MKALTIREPWAGLIACGAKRYETRGWSTRHRGWIAIHAAATFTPQDALNGSVWARRESGLHVRPGSVVAVATLIDCVRMTDELIREQAALELDAGVWSVGRWAWELANVRPLASPVPARGRQGLWRLPQDVAERVAAEAGL